MIDSRLKSLFFSFSVFSSNFFLFLALFFLLCLFLSLSHLPPLSRALPFSRYSSLLKKIERETWRESGISLIATVTRLMERLLDYRDCMKLGEVDGKKIGCTVSLLVSYSLSPSVALEEIQSLLSSRHRNPILFVASLLSL